MVTLNRQKDVDGQRIHKKSSKEEHSVHGVGVGTGGLVSLCSRALSPAMRSFGFGFFFFFGSVEH